MLRRALASGRIDPSHPALDVLHAFGRSAAAAIPEVRALRRQASDLDTQQQLDLLLIRLGDTAAITTFARRMWTEPIVVHMLLADLGPEAAPAVPELLQVLRYGAPEHQADAAHALGIIGDVRAIAPLVEQLRSRHWRTVDEAARALGRIGPPARGEAWRALAAVRDGHWSRFVRDAASVAQGRLSGEPPAEAPLADDETRVVSDHRRAGGEDHGLVCAPEYDTALPADRPPRCEIRLGGRWQEVDEAPEPPTGAALPPGTVLPPFHEFGNVSVVEVANGWLVGRDAGEWGGDLVFVRRDGSSERIFTGNVQAMVHIEGDLLAVTGLSHLDLDESALLQLWSDGLSWHAEPVAELPHAPYVSRLDPLTGKLIVVSAYEAALVDRDGAIELLPCRFVRD